MPRAYLATFDFHGVRIGCTLPLIEPVGRASGPLRAAPPRYITPGLHWPRAFHHSRRINPESPAAAFSRAQSLRGAPSVATDGGRPSMTAPLVTSRSPHGVN